MPTRAGLNPNFNMAAYHPLERQIISRLSQHFYITAPVDKIYRGNSAYNAFLMRPSDDLSVILNVEREIMVLFSIYDTFEARCISAYEAIIDKFDGTRIDKSIRFLVSKDRNIEGAVRGFLAENFEYPIVVPYRYSDFLSPTDDFIYSRIRSNHLIRDLFAHQNPLRKEYFFFGREAIVNGVLDQHLTSENSSLFGLRKSGKTSTIYAIERKAKSKGVKTLVIDCQDPAVHARSYKQLLEHLVERVRALGNLKKATINFGSSPAEVSDDFRERMSQALSGLRNNVLIIFDEIENISPRTAASPHWRDGRDSLLFWQILRSFFQRPPKYRLTYCFVGTNPHLLEMTKLGDIDNPVYLFARPVFMPNLTYADTKQMIRRLGYFMGLDFPEAVVSRIHSYFGGHPFFMRQICSKIHNLVSASRPATVSLQLCKQAESESAAINTQYIHQIIEHLRGNYLEEWDLLRLLALGQQEEFNEMVESFPAWVEHLVGYGLITKRGDDFEFVFDLVRHVVASDFAAPAGEPTIEERRQEISNRRNKLEEEIRSALYHWSRRLADQDWSALFKECSPRLGDADASLSRREVFSRNSSPLYWIELMRFVKHGNVLECTTEELTRVCGAFDTINKFRIDAHAKSIAAEEFEAWVKATEILEDCFLPP